MFQCRDLCEQSTVVLLLILFFLLAAVTSKEPYSTIYSKFTGRIPLVGYRELPNIWYYEFHPHSVPQVTFVWKADEWKQHIAQQGGPYSMTVASHNYVCLRYCTCSLQCSNRIKIYN